MRTGRKSAIWALRPAALLAILAILLRASIPGGFMLSSAKAGSLPALVICTAQGLMTLADHPDPGKIDDGKQDGACAFAATSGPSIAPAPVVIAAPGYEAEATADRIAADQRPGRGLAAPPPPTTGPPSIL
jgi:hypothetical protein